MHLTLHLTSRCNLRCRYCYAAPHGSTDMTIATLRAAIDLAVRETARAAPGERIGIVFYGGEPLLRRDLILEAVRYCRDIRRESGQTFHFKATTNGTALDEDFLSDPDTRQVFLSLSHDGTREAHDAGRVDAAGTGTYARLAPIVDMLLRDRPDTPAMMVVTPANVSCFASSVGHLFDLGFRYIVSTPDFTAAWSDSEMAVLGYQYEALAEWYYERSTREEKFFFSPFEVKIASHVRGPGRGRERCDMAARQISVAPDGGLFPCVQFADLGQGSEWCLGSVTDGIDEAARGRIQSLRREEQEACIRCAVRERCNHHCGCVNLKTTGSITGVSPVVCAHERIVLPIADALAARLFKRRNPLFLHKHYNDLYPIVSAVDSLSRRR